MTHTKKILGATAVATSPALADNAMPTSPQATVVVPLDNQMP